MLDAEKSESVKVFLGIPQGAILRSLIFLLHINDLPLTVTTVICLFADDYIELIGK